jgi:nucleotide-binding universal stress UspA family protein
MPELQPYRRILALIRFDATDGVTAEKALLLTRLNRAQLDFLHLIEPDGALDGGYVRSGATHAARALEAAALRRLDFLAARLGAGEARCSALYGPPRQGFQRHVAAAQPDLVVVGEPSDYVDGPHDVLVLSAPRRARGGRLRNVLRRLSGAHPALGAHTLFWRD